MKNYSSFGIAVLALMSVLCSGCDKVSELDDVQFHSEFEESIPMVDATESINKAYSESIIFDATTDAEINKYKSKIKSFKIDRLSYTIDDSANATAGAQFTGALGFSAADGGAATVFINVAHVDLDDNTTEHVINLAQADLDKIAGYLSANKALKMYVTGTVTKTPINVLVNVKINATVTANAL